MSRFNKGKESQGHRKSLGPLRRTGKSILLILLSIIFLFIITTFHIIPESPDMILWKECPPEFNRKSRLLAKKKVNIFPSNLVADQMDRKYKNKHLKFEGIECVNTSLPDHSKKYKICIHDPKQDLVISYRIKTFGFWERENVVEMYKAFQLFPQLVLMDLGSNVGTFTLPAALTGMEVIAVDALKENHQLLLRSLTVNDLSCKVTQVHNAIHNKRGPLRIRINPHNIGGSAVVDFPAPHSNSVQENDLVDAVCLDDLIPLVKGKNVFLKMDIEGSEESALECAHEFFKQVNVKVILMEWLNYRYNEKSSQNIKTFLKSHNMVPTWGVDRSRVIDLAASDSWPDNVFWMRD